MELKKTGGEQGAGAAVSGTDIRYQADEPPPPSVSMGLAFQYVALSIAGTILTPAIVVRSAGMGDALLTWVVFMALVVSGITTIVQVMRVGRVGAGYLLMMHTSGAFIAVSVAALIEGGPALLATLFVISSLFHFLLSWRLFWLRRIVTPTVAGTIIMLVAISVLPVVFDQMMRVPAGAHPAANAGSAAATLTVIIVIILRARSYIRLWAPMIGVVIGCIVAALFGQYDLERVVESPWLAIPAGGLPGLDTSLDSKFWALLPAFVLVTLAASITTVGDATAIQRLSWYERRALDYRAVQGAVNADGLGQLLSGLLGTVPSTTSSASVPMAEITGVSARVIGVYVGVMFLAVALLPKITTLLLAIPSPVVGAFMLVLLGMLFAMGTRIVTQGGLDYRRGIIVGVSLCIGTGFQNQSVVDGFLDGLWKTLLGNAVTGGGVAAILLSLLLDIGRGRRARLEVELNVDSLSRIETFLDIISRRGRWDDAAAGRLRAAAEEAVLTLIGDGAAAPRRLLMIARVDAEAAELEFIAAGGEGNLEDRMALLGEPMGTSIEQGLSLRLLRHYASSVSHRQYHDLDVLTVRVRKKLRRTRG